MTDERAAVAATVNSPAGDNEIDEKLWKKYPEKIEPISLPLFLRGTPRILARRIHREFPTATLQIEKTGEGKFVLIMGPPHTELFERYAPLFGSIREKKHCQSLVEITKEEHFYFSQSKEDWNRYCQDPEGMHIADFKKFPHPNGPISYLILWVLNATKKPCITEQVIDGKFYLKIEV